MIRPASLAGTVAGTVLVAALVAVAPAAASPPLRSVCGPAHPGHVRCLALLRTDVHGGFGAKVADAPPGYGPGDLRAAYHLPVTGGADQTVAIVDAGDDAHAEADLAIYRATYGLPPCTTANGCFRKVNQAGAAAPLPEDLGWGVEISLDLDMVSAACPACQILLVGSDDETIASVAVAENTAARLGADEISNSYGTTESHGTLPYADAYRHAGVAILASSGDFGYGIPSFPADLTSVVAVGGTSLTRDPGTARGWSEAAWSGAGSGCSAWIDKPAWQQDPNCPGRMIADVAAVADPDTGVAVYDGFDDLGWILAGGTSASSPLVAGVIALGGHPEAFGDASRLYSQALNDVTRGSNAARSMGCDGDYQCTAGPGYDGPTGNGTPNGPL